MAKYTVTHTCGHTQDVNLFGKNTERDRRIAWLETQPCPECKRMQELENAKEQASGLPELTGSERQIEWAMVIRQKWIDEGKKFCLDKNLDYDNSVKEILANYEAHKDYFDKNEERSHPISVEYRLLAAHIETSAKYFIDNR